MKILSIETSCDETGISIISVVDDKITVLANELNSQANLHAEFGGVYPTLAKREHTKALVPLLKNALLNAKLLTAQTAKPSKETITDLKDLLEKEQEIFVYLSLLSLEIGAPDIDAIAVTYGPGLEPALWVGVNFAKALSLLWNKPLVAVNHMEGHIAAALTDSFSPTAASFNIVTPKYPLLSLLVSGGHTELVLSNSAGTFEMVGQTRDDAAGECFDKTARMLGLTYPGGPEISKLASRARSLNLPIAFSLPRPMINSGTADFSFSGLKTAVLKLLREVGELDELKKMQIAREIEEAIVETIVSKTVFALDSTTAQSLVVSGGVSANTYLTQSLTDSISKQFSDVSVYISPRQLSTDNALMIALASLPSVANNYWAPLETLRAQGNIRLGNTM